MHVLIGGCMVMKSELATTHFATSCTCWCAVVVECINHLFTGGAKKKNYAEKNKFTAPIL
jgi:hypothetical protein